MMTNLIDVDVTTDFLAYNGKGSSEFQQRTVAMFKESTSLSSGRVYQRSRPEINSPSLMEGSSENSEVKCIYTLPLRSYNDDEQQLLCTHQGI